MAQLIHEIWEERDEDGAALHTCCFAGPLGDRCRATLSVSARLLTTFKAGSHLEAMTIYNRTLGREPYSSRESADTEPYPDEWLEQQSSD